MCVFRIISYRLHPSYGRSHSKWRLLFDGSCFGKNLPIHFDFLMSFPMNSLAESFAAAKIEEQRTNNEYTEAVISTWMKNIEAVLSLPTKGENPRAHGWDSFTFSWKRLALYLLSSLTKLDRVNYRNVFRVPVNGMLSRRQNTYFNLFFALNIIILEIFVRNRDLTTFKEINI